jgi:hypothetical protein
MRVTTRRLQASIDLLEREMKLRKQKRRLRSWRRKLSTVRNYDVFLELIEKEAASRGRTRREQLHLIKSILQERRDERATQVRHFLESIDIDRLAKRFKIRQTPVYLDFLKGNREMPCTAWGNPTYNVFGWQLPCYLLADGYVDTFAELMENTRWENYGTESGNPKCANCMVHSGYEASAVDDTFSSLKGFLSTVRATMLSGKHKDAGALEALEERSAPVSHVGLVQVNVPGQKEHAKV